MAYPYNPDDVQKNLGLGAGASLPNRGKTYEERANDIRKGIGITEIPIVGGTPRISPFARNPRPVEGDRMNPYDKDMEYGIREDRKKYIMRDEFGYPMTGLGQPATPLISTKVTGQQLQPTAAPTMPGRGVPNPRGINELTSLRDFSALPMGRTQNPNPRLMFPMPNPNSIGHVGEPGVGVTLNSGPALQIGGTDRYGNPFQPMGPVPRRTPYELIDMFSEEKARDYIGRISDDEAKKIDPRGKQGLIDYLLESLKKRKIPKPPRQFEWRGSGQPAPEKDWEAITDFKRFIGMSGGKFKDIDVQKALKFPDMVNQSFGKSLTVTNLTPELRASLERQGLKFKTWDEKLFPNMNNLGGGKLGILEFESGVGAFQNFEKLKSLGAEVEVSPFAQVSNKFYG